MSNLCVLCDEHEADFDQYLCGDCAKEFQADSSNVRLFYRFLATVGRSYLSSFVAGTKTPEEQSYIFSAPAVNFHNARRFNFFCRIAELVRGIPGDIVECGVEHGQSLLFWLSIAFDELTPRNVWGFDSFVGPESVTENDANAVGDVWRPKVGSYSDKTTQNFINALNAYGLPAIWTNSHLTIVPGFFSKTLNDYKGERIAILHLDCNYYDSYRACLETLWPKVVQGGVVVFDEYSGTNDLLHFNGAKKAIDEWNSEVGRQTILRDKMYGKWYLVKMEVG